MCFILILIGSCLTTQQIICLIRVLSTVLSQFSKNVFLIKLYIVYITVLLVRRIQQADSSSFFPLTLSKTNNNLFGVFPTLTAPLKANKLTLQTGKTVFYVNSTVQHSYGFYLVFETHLFANSTVEQM
mgnify:CR=1 FL=1